MLNLYRRHLVACPNTKRTQKKCQCPIWVQGTLRGVWMKKSVDGIRNWEAAQKIVRDWEAGVQVASITVPDACDRFSADCKARALGDETQAKYTLLLDELKAAFPKRQVASISTDDLRELREAWTLSPITVKKKIERLRAFFRFCQESSWCPSNAAKAIKAPLVKQKPTLPFTEPQIRKIVLATEVYSKKGIYGAESGERVRAFVLLLLNSGLRIQDAATLPFDRINDDRLLLYTQKTGQPVHLPLPPELTTLLGKIKASSKTYPFWSGEGERRSVVKDWQRSLRKLFKLAGIENGHAHRFRDTFACRLLVKGVPLGEVSILLGHSNTNITQKHYAPWIKERQERLEELVKRAWA